MHKHSRATRRLALPLVVLAACLWSEAALADPPWRRGHHEHGWSNRGHGYGHWHGHGRHREHRGWQGRPVIVVPPPVYRPPPVVVIPGYAAPYSYGRGWGYAPYGGEAELRLRIPFR